MKTQIILIFMFSFISINSIFCQERYTISGYVKEEETGEVLIGTNVYVKELMKGTTTNQYGFYSLNLDKGTYTIVSSFLGFQTFESTIKLDKDIRLNIALKSQFIQQKEVVITGEKSDKNVKGTDMGTVKIPVEKIKTLPAFLGEVDVLKTIQLLPGVKSGGEGNSGFYVRGGGPDQNLILLDEAIVYNASHLFGFFSVFNADAIRNVNLIKGGMPANYGGRLSSVLDISMSEGNFKKYHAEGGIGLISSRLTIQGPIKQDTSSFMISARRTYADLLIKPFVKKTSSFKGSGYYFYDLNAKINYRISDKDRVYLSGYFGRDIFGFKSSADNFDMKFPWGNATTSLRWNHLFNSKLFVNTSLIFSNYFSDIEINQDLIQMKLHSGIEDWTAKCDFNYMPNIRHNIKFGSNYIYHIFVPSDATGKSDEIVFDTGKLIKLRAHELALYINDDFDVTEKFKVSAGARYSLFQQIGPFDRYIKNGIDETIDTIAYSRGENVKTYPNIEPRISLRYSLNGSTSLKAAYTQNYQYIHLATVSSGTLPTDIWVPSTSLVKPQFSTQYAIGYFKNFKKDTYETSLELYYKDMDNLIEYKEGFIPDDNIKNNVDNNFVFGQGESYGAELFVKKRTGKTTGWVGYTHSYTNRIFPDLNNGKAFPAKYDRRHDVSIVISHELSEKWTFSAIWVYSTGDAITLPISRYFIEGEVISQYAERNSFRMKPYHRLDISATYNVKKNRKIESSWNFSIFNVYNRMNPYFIYFSNTGDVQKGTLQIQAKQVSLFTILPSITWNFKF